MAAELFLSTLMVLLTVAIHAIGLFLLSRLLRLEERDERQEHVHSLSGRGIIATLAVSLSLFALHGVEIWLYALVYLAIGSIEGLREAVYFRPAPTVLSATATRRWQKNGASYPRSRE